MTELWGKCTKTSKKYCARFIFASCAMKVSTRAHTHTNKSIKCWLYSFSTNRPSLSGYAFKNSCIQSDKVTWGTKIWWQMTISRKQLDRQRRSQRYCIVLTVPVVQSSVSPTVNNLRDPQQSYKHGVYPALACPGQKGTNGLSAIPQAYLRKFLSFQWRVGEREWKIQKEEDFGGK